VRHCDGRIQRDGFAACGSKQAVLMDTVKKTAGFTLDEGKHGAARGECVAPREQQSGGACSPAHLPTARRPALANDCSDALIFRVSQRRALGVFAARAGLVPRVPRESMLIVLPDRGPLAPAAVKEIPFAVTRYEPRQDGAIDPAPRFDHARPRFMQQHSITATPYRDQSRGDPADFLVAASMA